MYLMDTEQGNSKEYLKDRRPKMTWKQLTERDCRKWKLSAINNPHDRHTWRSVVRSAKCAASQLEGGPLMWMLPLYLHVNQKSDYDDMMKRYVLVLKI